MKFNANINGVRVTVDGEKVFVRGTTENIRAILSVDALSQIKARGEISGTWEAFIFDAECDDWIESLRKERASV